MGASESSPQDAVRLYLDEHVSPAVASYLRRYDIDVLTTQEAGRASQGITDADQLDYATANRRVLVSRDSDFLNPHVVPQLATGRHAGVVVLSRTSDIAYQGRYLRYVAATETPSSVTGQVLFSQVIPPGIFDDDV